MDVIPAVDLRDGRCVRLYQGDYGRETIYSDDPVEIALRWVNLGARRIHIVDLDGARNGELSNVRVIEKIVTSVPVPVQMGGGIRSFEDAKIILSLGVDRVMIGTASVEDPDIIQEMCEKLGANSVVVGVDVRDGYVAVKGWTHNSEILASELIKQMTKRGVLRFLYTDITRDGTLSGPNYSAIQALSSQMSAFLMAAGGISSVEHLLRLSELGVEGAIVGTALYTGDIQLTEAFQVIPQQ